jgi:hypothetical protein
MNGLPNVGEVLRTHAQLFPDRVGARDLERTMTFRQWNARSCRLANALLGLGLGKGSPPHRKSIRTLRASVQPTSASACANAEMIVFTTGSLSSRPVSTPMRRTRSACCARATTGHAAELPSPAMNARRFIE